MSINGVDNKKRNGESQSDVDSKKQKLDESSPTKVTVSPFVLKSKPSPTLEIHAVATVIEERFVHEANKFF